MTHRETEWKPKCKTQVKENQRETRALARLLAGSPGHHGLRRSPVRCPGGLRQGNFPVALKPKRRERGCLDPRQLHPILQPPQHLIWHLGRVTEGVNRSLPRSYFRGRLKQFLLCYAVAPITGSKCDSLRRRRRKGGSTMLEMQEERSAHQAAPGSCKPGLWGRGGQSGFCQLWAKVLGTLSQEQF